MPTTVILLPNGQFSLVAVPGSAPHLTSVWKQVEFFPCGVFLHKMMHIVDVETIGKIISGPILPDMLTVSLLLDERLKSNGHHLSPNFHELPKQLDTCLFYGALMIILTIDGSTIIPFNRVQLKTLLNSGSVFSHVTTPIVSPETGNSLIRPFISNTINGLANLGPSTGGPRRIVMPSFSDDEDDMQLSDDELGLRPMEISDEEKKRRRRVCFASGC